MIKEHVILLEIDINWVNREELQQLSMSVSCLPLRAVPAFLLFLCTFTQYVTRVSINVAILDMTRNASDICGDRSASGM